MKLKALAIALLGLAVLMPPTFSIQAFGRIRALDDPA